MEGNLNDLLMVIVLAGITLYFGLSSVARAVNRVADILEGKKDQDEESE